MSKLEFMVLGLLSTVSKILYVSEEEKEIAVKKDDEIYKIYIIKEGKV